MSGEDRRENIELRKQIDEMIECKGDECETRKLLADIRELKEYYEEEASAYREAIQKIIKLQLSDKTKNKE